MNSRRFMSDMGFSPTARRRATGEPGGDPRSRFAATLSLTRSDRHVLGADLNRSDRPSQPDPSSTTRASSGSKALYQSEKSHPIAPGDHQLAQVEERTRPARL